MTGSSELWGTSTSVSEEEFLAELRTLGCTAPLERIAKWREAGLVPAAHQRPVYRDGQFHGSAGLFPLISAKQTLAVERVLAQKSLYAYAGVTLWMAGFQTRESYWRPMLSDAEGLVQSVRTAAVEATSESEASSDTFGDQTAKLGPFVGALGKVVRRTPAGQLPMIFNVAATIIAGEFEQFATSPHDEGELSEIALFERVLDMSAAREHAIGDAQLNLVGELSGVMKALSDTIREFELSDFSNAEIEAARDDVRNALKVALCLYESTSWAYGPEAFGLRLAAQIARNMDAPSFFVLVVLFARLRRTAGQFLTSSEIATLARNAEENWLKAKHIRSLERRAALSKHSAKDAGKSALVDSPKLGELIKEIETYATPTSSVRPWDQWTTLSGKTMSPGLLAMSIGAPSELSLADIVPSESARANR